MNSRLGIVAALLLLVFAAITLVKRDSDSDTEEKVAIASQRADRKAIARFWELYREATEHRIAGRTEQATRAYEDALALNARHEDALYYVGNMYRDVGRDLDAKAAWSRLIEVNSQSARGHSELADLHFCLRRSALFDLDVAEAEVRRALELNQEETGPLLRLGQIALVRNDLTQASDYFDQVVASNFKSVEAHYLKGYVAWQRGRRPEAADAFEQAVQHAQPAEPVAGVLGEGDTKVGSSPLGGDQSDCETMPVPLDELAALEGADGLDSMVGSYRRFDARLREIRAMRDAGREMAEDD